MEPPNSPGVRRSNLARFSIESVQGYGRQRYESRDSFNYLESRNGSRDSKNDSRDNVDMIYNMDEVSEKSSNAYSTRSGVTQSESLSHVPVMSSTRSDSHAHSRESTGTPHGPDLLEWTARFEPEMTILEGASRDASDVTSPLHSPMLSYQNVRQLQAQMRKMTEPGDLEQDMHGWEDAAMRIVSMRGKRVSLSGVSQAESYVDDMELAENPEGSLAFTVFGPLQRMARMSEEELGKCLMLMDQAASQRQPLSQMLRGELLSGMAVSTEVSSRWVAKLNMGKVVRFFFSSTFVDTELERDLFLEDCVPFLRRVTALQGVEFQVSEMRWGINNMMSESHRTSRECMKELTRCKESSMGLAFVGLIGDRYGYRPFPPVIASDLFEKMRDQVEHQRHGGRELLEKWFTEDLNVVPPVYRLSPIHVHLPAYIDMTKEGVARRQTAEAEWWSNNFELMQDDLRQAAISLLENKDISAETADLFVRSVTEEEMVTGILEQNEIGIMSERQEKRSALLIRNLVGIRDAPWTDPAKAKFIDKEKGHNELDHEAAELVKTLRDRLIASIPPERLFEFDVEWEEGGIDPAKHEMHRSYLAGLTDTLVSLNIEEIVEQLKERPLLTNLESEIMHHLDLCLEKSKAFAGRKPVLARVMDFLTATDGPTTLVVVGESGVGKSFVMAEACKRMTRHLDVESRKLRKGQIRNSTAMMSAESLEWKDFSEMGHKMEVGGACVMLRFIGTHMNSRTSREIMRSCCAQATSFFSSLPEDVPSDYLSLKDALPHSLSRATEQRPIYLFLDAIDQIADIDVGKPLAWLPMGAGLPPNVKLVLSVAAAPGGKPSSLLKSIMSRVAGNAEVVTIQGFEEGEREQMVVTWLERDGRELTTQQRDAIITASLNDCTALLPSILYQRSREWTSSTTLEDIGRIPDNVEEAINQMFDELEKIHTPELVGLVLGAITASKDGMSAAELEDLASSSDEVLLALFVWWAPPMARVPPLQVVRLLHDISEYVTESVGSGLQVVYQWTHRLLFQEAQKRYLSDSKSSKKLYEALSDLFSGAKSKKNLPLTVRLSSGEVKELPGNRRLPGQEPVLVRIAGDPVHYNERMLTELPHHLLKAGRYLDLVGLVTDPEVFEYYMSDRNQPVLAQIWRELIASAVRASPLIEYTKMLDDLDREMRKRKEASLSRKIGEFLSTLLARTSDAKVFMQRSVQVSEELGNRLETARGLDGVAKVELLQGNYDSAIKSLNRSLMIKVEELGGKNLEVAATMHTTADALQKQSKLKEALRVFTESCEIRRELQGGDSMDVAISLDRMGVVHKKLGNYPQALSNFLQSKEIFEHRLGKDNLTVAGALMNLGNVLKYLGKYEEAIERHSESVSIKKRILGQKHPEVAKSLGNLASVFEKVDQPDMALKHYAECLEVQKATLGPRSQDVARTLRGRGVILREKGRLDEALEDLDEALSITEKAVGHMHRDVAALLLVIAECLFHKCMYSEALVKYQDAIQITRLIIGQDRPHVDIAMALRGKGSILLNTGGEDQALAIFKESHGIFVACVGNRHSEVAMSLDMIALALARLGRYEEALLQHNLARDARNETEADRRAVAANLVYIADIHAKTGEFSHALEHYKMAMEIQSDLYKEQASPQMAQTLSSMGVVYKKLGLYQLAVSEYEKANEMLRGLYGQEHLSVAIVMMNQANVYHHMGMYEQALEKHEESLRIKEKLLGERHREVAKSLGNTALTYQRLGRLDDATKMYERCLKIQLQFQSGRTIDVARTLRGMAGVLSSQVCSRVFAPAPCNFPLAEHSKRTRSDLQALLPFHFAHLVSVCLCVCARAHVHRASLMRPSSRTRTRGRSRWSTSVRSTSISPRSTTASAASWSRATSMTSQGTSF